ncbi:MAG: MarR family transcriptional regulator [Terracidiphilus sp.]|nr:MarR family transcriptional regulator [Terracidiphilus sp.]MDR3775538.1 MarR family transcriptional regulator [Terracidiphilus sp.]
MASLKLEIVQELPFSSTAEEAFLNVLRTSDCLSRAFHRITRSWGLTSTQYNVLRILRGAHPQGLTCSAIGSRMIAAEPDITRLLARLKTLKLVEQHRDAQDRRVVWTHISKAGLKLLQEMDPVIRQFPGDMLEHLDSAELAELIRLLELVRKPSEGQQTPISCDGSKGAGQEVCAAPENL